MPPLPPPRTRAPLVFLLVFAGALASAFAETPAPAARAMTLSEALAEARAHQPSLVAARARVAASQAEAQVPAASWMPRVAATAQLFEGTTNNSTASYLSAPGVDLARIGGTKVTSSPDLAPSTSTLVGIGLRQEIYDFGRIAAFSAVGNATARADEARADTDTRDVELAVVESFLAVKASQALLAAADASEQRARAARDLAQAGVKSGLRRPIELTRTEAELARAQLGQIRARGGLQSARIVFAAVVGVPDPALDAAGEAPNWGTLSSLDQLISAAAERDPALREARERLGAQQARVTAIGAELRPDLALSAAVSSRAGGAQPSSGEVPVGAGWLPDVPNYAAGVVLSWPLYDQAVAVRRRAAQAQTDARRAEVEAAQRRISTAVQQAYLGAQLSQEALGALEKAEEAARANYVQAETRFGAGLGTSVELADAAALRTEAETQLAVGQFEEARARARLRRAAALDF